MGDGEGGRDDGASNRLRITQGPDKADDGGGKNIKDRAYGRLARPRTRRKAAGSSSDGGKAARYE
jgi:hypothetical protein